MDDFNQSNTVCMCNSSSDLCTVVNIALMHTLVNRATSGYCKPKKDAALSRGAAASLPPGAPTPGWIRTTILHDTEAKSLPNQLRYKSW